MAKILRYKWPLLLFIVILFYPLIVGGSNYYIIIVNMVAIYAIASLALNLLTGYGGQVSVGHAGFLSIGAYTAAIFSTKLGMPFWIALPISGVVTGIIGFLIGIPAVRLKGHFLAVATLGFGVSIPLIAMKWDKLTGGFAGISVLKPALFSTSFSFFYLVVFATVFLVWIIYNIINSSMGRAFIAIRESEIAATVMGINVPFYKAIMFSVSAFITGLAGGLYVFMVGFISPNDFTVTTSFLILAMIIVGGLASLPGSILGAALMTLLPYMTDKWIGVTNTVIGLVMGLVIIFLPNGLISILQRKKKTSTSSSHSVNPMKGGERNANV
ncbi:branched-chain amino acid ABC transporter permease [Bacillus sp. V5-8f]|uniref:branched-chain amino acid ABC transporter permease n=1 Tax=Bacillus sp. V5-8f TaxID=2053044 RepID=UPI000C76FE6D|nr:branched-chain amino acid ABC transporter permease [Bacillus sp. V5-8f]PLT33492.1 branched-chain amino acid ABC transporter permease [Bacillus sp. V5-8f]